MIFSICFFTMRLGTSFTFLLVSSLHLNKLVDLFDISSLDCVYGKDMICTMCLIYSKTMLMLNAHPSISLIKCLAISHIASSVEQVFICCKCYVSFPIYSLALVCVQNYLGGSDDSMLYTLY